MDEEIKVGEKLLDYVGSMAEIYQDIQSAELNVVRCIQIFQEGNIYKGKAEDEINLFLLSLESNIQKMMMLYQTGMEYIMKTYETMYYSDKQIAEWLAKQIGDANGKR